VTVRVVDDGTDDVDPDDVGDVIDRFSRELPHAPGSAAPELVALRRAYYVLKDAGQASSRHLAREVWTASPTLDRLYSNPSDWWTAAGQPFLRLLPGVDRDDDGDGWRYNPNADVDDRPAVPDDPVDPTPGDVDATLSTFDFPAANERRTTRRNRLGVKRAFQHLQEHGEADAAALKDQFAPSPYTRQPGHFDNAHDWFREVGRPALRTLPGVDPPRVAGQSWRYIGGESA
jgi:hypothetical protein